MVSDEVGHLAKTLRGAVDGSQELLANRETGGARVTLVQPADCRAPIADAANPPDG